MEKKQHKPRKDTKSSYRVEIRGKIPAGLKERISALQALCILKGREGHPPAETGDVLETEEEDLGLNFPRLS